jgi:hypothetical protein
MSFRADVRAAAAAFLTDYAVNAGIGMQVYPARPASLMPPTGFVDRITESDTNVGVVLTQRYVRAEVVIVHGLFDSKEAADNADAFVDGLFDWINARVHQAGANTTIGLLSMDDEPGWSPDWKPANLNTLSQYYATRITLEGFAG